MTVQGTAQRPVVQQRPAVQSQPRAENRLQQASTQKASGGAGYSGTSSFQPSASAPGVDLQRGSTGAAVKQLQDDLVKLGYMTQAQVNTGPGTFGPQTEAAVKRFQGDHGVPQTGYYGPMTRAAMNQALGAQGNKPPADPPPSTSGSAEVQDLMQRYPVGSYGGQCSGFAAVAAHVPGFPRADGLGPVNGNQMVDFLTSGGHGYHRVDSPAAGDIFSMNTGTYGHTGVVVGVHDNMVTVLDSNWNLDERVRVHDIPLNQFSGFARKD